MKVQSIYSSKILKKCFEFAANNGSLFAATATLGFSAVRPLVILATPKTDKENKYYASTKSIASTLIGYVLMLGASKPIAKAVKNIDNNPTIYLKPSTIKNLKAGEKSLSASKKYSFATQLFKLGVGFILAAPKSILTCSLIPPIMTKLFKKDVDNKTNNTSSPSKVNFTGLYNNATNRLSKGIGKIIDTDVVQNFAEKFKATRFEQHIISLSDVIATAAFIQQTKNNSKIKEDRKTPLIYNAAISTGLSVIGGYIVDSLTKKPTEKFIEKFRQINMNSSNLDTYVQGIRVVKPVIILGSLYYVFIPLVSTFFADKIPTKMSGK